MDKKIMDRLNRLHAMANDASSEHEAMIAARRLHFLLAKHGLSEMDLGQKAEEIGRDEFSVTQKMGGGWWSKQIAARVAELYFCKAYMTNNGGTGHRVVVAGTPANRQTAITMAQNTIRAVDTEARLSSAKDRPKGEDGWAYITSFRNGAAHRIAERCAQMILDARQGNLVDEDGSRLPVLASLYDREFKAVSEYLARTVRLASSRVGRTTSSLSGAQNGVAYGNRVQLSQSLSSRAPKLLGK